MPVTVTDTVSTYAGNGSTTTPYAITIPRSRDEDLFLELDGVNSTDFTISPDGFRTGTAQASTVTLVLYRATPRTQDQPFPSNTTPAAEDVRAAIDKLSLTTQEADETAARAVKAPIGTTFGVSSTIGLNATGVAVSRTVVEEVAHLGISERIDTASFAAASATQSAEMALAAANTIPGGYFNFSNSVLYFNFSS
jgi:hypothetical protein